VEKPYKLASLQLALKKLSDKTMGKVCICWNQLFLKLNKSFSQMELNYFVGSFVLVLTFD